MEIKIVYPELGKKKLRGTRYLFVCGTAFAAAAVVSVLVNLAVGGKAWSVIVSAALLLIWKLALARDLVEYNRVSQSAKWLIGSCIMLILIELFLAPGWAVFVVPIVFGAGLLVSGTLFISDLRKQKHNMKPLLILIIIAFAGAAAARFFMKGLNIPLIVLLALSAALLIALTAILKSFLLRELRCRLHTK